MYLSTLSAWLSWISSIHVTEIDLGLDRVKVVAERLGVLSPVCPVIIVGGTNGKGSTVAGLEAIYQAAGYQVGTFTSPVLFTHNEQVKINGQPCHDALFCEAFEKIAKAREDISLTPFEFHALAALLILQDHALDVMILEVGLGGRLDAVNIIDADVAVVTSIDIDHTDWLGHTREAIAFEKAGIFRNGKPAVCGDFNPPLNLVRMADRVGAPLYCQGKDFHYQETAEGWNWEWNKIQYHHLPLNSLARQNMSSVLMVISLLQSRLPVTQEAISQGSINVKLPGRQQVIFGETIEIFDVSHNPAAVAFLAKRLLEIPYRGKTYAVFSMLADKNILESIKAITTQIDAWYAAPLAGPRAAPRSLLQQSFYQAGIDAVQFCASIGEAYQSAKEKSQPGDRIIVFGSFHTVAEAWAVRGAN